MISIIIPTFNEAEFLPLTLKSLRGQGVALETIVVDSGSSDETVKLAREAGCKVIECPIRQRATQMNLGAIGARGDVLLFLHADTVLPPTALARVEDALKQNRVLVGGGFARRYRSPSLFLRFSCWMAELRTRTLGWFRGDQAIFIRAQTFQRLHGFREWDTFEDLDLCRRMSQIGGIVTIRPPVLSAARRFSRNGPAGTTVRDLFATLRFIATKQSELSIRFPEEPTGTRLLSAVAEPSEAGRR